MVAGGSLDIGAEKEANMEETKKTKGAWVIRVRGGNAEKSTVTKYSPSSSDATPHCNGQGNTTDKEE